MAKKELIEFILNEMQNKNLDKDKGKAFLKDILSDNSSEEDIAIIGVSCRFPEADSTDEFWKNLVEGKDSVGVYPKNRMEDLLRISESPTNAMKGGFLKRVDLFDPEYFGMSPKACVEMDPYHRIMLEVFVEALEDAGYYMDQIQGRKIGVYVGNDMTHRMVRSYFPFLSDVAFSALVGSWTSILASRLSYIFNLSGPAMVLDTGCSSALTALDTAVKALRNNDCETAFVGGINLLFDPSALAEQTLSEDYVVRSFDGSANGTVWSEGAGGVYLKPLSKAIKDGDSIYGVVKGIAVNCDGSSNGITAPNARAQTDVIMEAWKRAKINPEDISYIEAHGTGTVLGDPIEIKGLTQAYANFGIKKKQICAIGTVKTNIGHAVGAAGMASLIKVLLSFKHEYLPASIHFRTPNELIDFCNSPLYMQDMEQVWKSDEKERIACINGFSLGGTNVHVVLQSYSQPLYEAKQNRDTSCSFVVSNKNLDLVLMDLYKIGDHISLCQNDRYEDICYTLWNGRKKREYSLCFLCDSLSDLQKKIERTIELLESGYEHYERHGIFFGSSKDLFQKDQLTVAEKELLEAAFGKTQVGRDIQIDTSRNHVHLPAASFDNRRMWDEDAVKRILNKEEQKESIEKDLDDILKGNKTYLMDHSDRNEIVGEVIAYIWKKVLGYDQISMKSDFYMMGGDSINALTIIQMMNKIFHINVHNSLVLEKPVFADFLEEVKTAYGITSVQIEGVQECAQEDEEILDEEKVLELTSSQKSIFLSVYGKEPSVTYNISGIAKNKGVVDRNKLEKVLQQLVRRHESLRTTFTIQDAQPVQIVHPVIETKVELYQLEESDQLGEEEILQKKLNEVIRPFDIEKGPLFRISYIEGFEGNSYLVFDIHHIVSDGFSMGVLYKDFLQMMTNQKVGAIETKYSEAVCEICKKEQAEEINSQREWWKSQFVDPVPEMNLFTRKFRRPIENRKGKILSYQIDQKLLLKCKERAKELETTNYVMLLSILHTLLSLYSNVEDIVIGTPVAGRNFQGGNDLIGMFVNTIPLRLYRDKNESFSEYIGRIKTTVLDSFRNSDYSYEQLMKEVDIPFKNGRNPLFDVYFAMHNIDMGLDENVSFVDFHNGSAKFDLTVTARENADGLLMQWEYDVDLYEESTIATIASRFERLALLVCDERKEMITASDLMLSGEEERLINQYGRLESFDHEERSICTIFEEYVAITPDKIWLLNDTEQYTFAEANQKANYIAKQLIKAGVKPGDPVALMVEHNCDMMIAMLAIMKCGAYYVPMYIKLPMDRLRVLLTDSEAKVIVTQKDFADRIQEVMGDSMLQYQIPKDTEVEECENINLTKSSEDKAYMMYTSGTTNVPKGVIIRHKSIIRVVKNNGYVDFLDQDVLMTIANYSFDGSIFDIFGSILNGLTLVVPNDDDVTDIPRLTEIIQKYHVSAFFITTSLFNALIDTSVEELKGVRKIVFGGEAASSGHVKRGMSILGKDVLVNGYGPTESCVFASTYTFHDDIEGFKIPIGKPIRNTQLYVLDEDRKILPVGIPGELFIGGDGIGLGYYKQDDRTREAFIESELINGSTLYKTGDYAVWGEDGLLYYLGRKDKQIKLRGYRIECEEICGIAMSAPFIKSAYCDVYESESHSKTLCMWVVEEKGQKYEEEELRVLLQAKLPQYMIPSFIIVVDKFPVTKNGKVAFDQLPKPSQSTSDETIVEAETEMESILVAIWESVLGNGKVSVEADFFQLGGDSIKAIQIISRLKEQGLQLALKDIFSYQTIRSIALHVEKARMVIERNRTKGFIENQMSPVQKLFLQNTMNRKLRFTQALKFVLPEKLQEEQVKQAWMKVAECHPMLRLQMKQENQLVIGSLSDCLVIKQNEVENEETFFELSSKIDLENGPVTAILLTNVSEGTLLQIAIHHMAVDVVSWGIIIEDFVKCIRNQNVSLVGEMVSFEEWTDAIREYYQADQREIECRHWKVVSEQCQEEGRLFGNSLAKYSKKHSKKIVHTIVGDQIQMLMNEIRNEYGISMQNLVLCILSLALTKWKRRKNVVINMERHGRFDFDGTFDLTRTVGWFTEYCPIVLSDLGSIGDLIQTMKKIEYGIPNDGIGYGVMKYLLNDLSEEEQSIFDGITPEINYNFLGKQEQSMIQYYNDHVTVDEMYENEWFIDMVTDYDDHGVRFDIEYVADVVDEIEINELIIELENAVERVVEDYIEKGDITTFVTNSTSSISESELESIFDELML